MILGWSETAWTDYRYWQSVDRSVIDKINGLICDAMRSPFSGIGKPEPLKGRFAGLWSRRITAEHRLLYKVMGTGEQQMLMIIACRHHYD